MPRTFALRTDPGRSLTRVQSTVTSAFCSTSERPRSCTRFEAAIPCGNPKERTRNTTCKRRAGGAVASSCWAGRDVRFGRVTVVRVQSVARGSFGDQSGLWRIWAHDLPSWLASLASNEARSPSARIHDCEVVCT